VINQNYSIIFPEAIRDYARQQYPISFASPTIPPQFDTTIQRKDGQQRMVESRIAFVVQDGQRKAMLSVIHDITERKQVEALLKERNQALEKAQADLINEHNRLIAVMEALPVGLCILDRKGKVIQANKSYEEIWGGPRLPAKSGGDYEAYQAWWVETGQRVLPEEWASTRALLNGETITGQYLQIQRFDGTRGFVLNSGAPTRDSQGEITGSAVAVMDITEWVQTEAALEESERIRREANDRFRVALASVPLFVYTCDRDLRYTWLYQLPRGFKEEEVLGKRDDEILTPEAAGELIAAKQQALDTGKGGVREVKVPLYGEDIYYILTTEPIQDTQGNISGLTCSAIDITSQKQLENEYRERAMLLEIQRRLAELREKERQVIARDIHDGPIQTLVGTLFNVQIAKEAVNDPVAQLEFAQIGLSLQNTVHELREVVNELRPPSLIRFGLGKTIKIYLEDLREKHPQLRIQAELADDGVQVPEATRLALFRICQEALNNVIRHANATQVWLCYTVAENTALLEVRDNGQGMPALNSLVDQTRSGHYGMAGMKERAEALGGTLTVTSAPGQGTTICVWTPIG
jgi:PAS domain S-box-containing protein